MPEVPLSETPIRFHAQRKWGPFTYADREVWGVRVRAFWVLGRLVVRWRVR